MLEALRKQISKKGGITPFLFIYKKTVELYYEALYQELEGICKQCGVDIYSVHKLERDVEESHKIQNVKAFIEKGNTRARQDFQVFVFEDFGRLTPQSQNACLKFIEEPGEGNIIILTSPSEQGILDTILSRVQIYSDRAQQRHSQNPFFISLIASALSGDKLSLIKYFFSQKREKDEYLDFLKTLLYYLVSEGIYPHLHEKIHDDIVGIESNNFIARSIVDMYVLEL